MTTLAKCLIISAVMCFTSEIIAAQTPVQYPVQNPSALINIPPYISFSGFPKPHHMSDSIDQELKNIAHCFKIPVEFLYQQYAMIDQDLMSVTPEQNVQMIHDLSQAVYNELTQGSPTMPPSLSQHLPKMPSMPSISSYLNMPNIPTMSSFTRTSQKNPMQMNTMQYQNLYKRDPQQGLLTSMMNDMSSNLKAGYNNMMNYVNKIVPETSQSMSNVIRSIVGSNASPQDQGMVDQLTDKMQSNVRHLMNSLGNTMSNLL